MHNLVIFVFIALCLSEPLISFTLKQQNFHFSSSLRARPITTDTIRTSTAQYPSLSFSPPLLSTPLLQKYKKDPFVPLNTLIIDNYDSYTFNIWQYLAEINKRAPTVIYNNNWDYLKWLEETNYAEFDSIILSPGPGSVINHEDFGICRDVILRTPLPLLGVCLGHQGIAHVFGGHVGKAPEPVHGRIWNVDHRGTGLFRGVAPHTPVTRYHSLAVYNEASHPLPSCLEVTAKTAEGVIMALKHKTRPLYGI